MGVFFTLLGGALKFLPGGTLSKLIDYFSKKDSEKFRVLVERLKVELEGRKAEIAADVEIRKAVAEKQLVDKSRWETRWIRPAFALTILVYIWAVLYDCLNLEKWGTAAWSVDAFPDSLAWLPMAVVSTYFLVRPFEKKKKK